MSGQIILLTGTPAAGKSTIARALLEQCSLGLHIPVDDIRGWVLSGRSDTVVLNDKTNRQLLLARQTAVATAKLYAQNGFTVVIDDLILPPECQLQYEVPLREQALTLVMLRPTLKETLARNAYRQKGLDQTLLDPLIPAIYEAYGQEDLAHHGWHIINSTYLTINQTVEQISSIINKA